MNEGFIHAKIDLYDNSFQTELNTDEFTSTIESTGEFSAGLNTDEITTTLNTDSFDCETHTTGEYTCETIPNYTVQDNKEKEVNFYDYDGTLLYSFYASEFLLRDKMPNLPKQNELICEGWNWSLENARQQVLTCNKCDIGAIYKTIDGTTKIKVDLDDILLNPYLKIIIGGSSYGVDGTVTVNWGDGIEEDIIGHIDSPYIQSSDIIYTGHTYSQGGKYTISLKPTEDTTIYFYNGILNGNGSNDAYYHSCVTDVFVGNQVCVSYAGLAYLNHLKTVSLPMNITFDERQSSNLRNLYMVSHINIPNTILRILSSCFNECSRLRTVSLPDSIIEIQNSSFYANSLLKRIIVPYNTTYIRNSSFYTCTNLTDVFIGNAVLEGTGIFRGCSYLIDFNLGDITTIPSNCFHNCSNLKTINLGNRLEGIGTEAFRYCTLLLKVKFPKTLSYISGRSFYGCTSAKLYDFSECENIPTLGSNSFYDIPSNCQIVVPDDLYEDWITTTNWSDLAEHIVKASEV